MRKARLIFWKSVVLTVLSIFFSLPGLAREPDLLLSTFCGAPFSKPDMTGFLDQIVLEAFKRIDLEISIVNKPAERSLQDANNGKADGEFMRIAKIGELYPNLLIVPEPLFDLDFVAFAKSDEVKISDWQSLAPYSVGIVRGGKILEANVKYTRGDRNDVTDEEQLFKILDSGRIDIAVHPKQFGQAVIDRLGLQGIKNLTPPLATQKMFLFLHKKHENVIPKLEKALRAMKEDGTFARIKEKTLP